MDKDPRISNLTIETVAKENPNNSRSLRFTRTTQAQAPREWKSFHSLVLVLMLASLRRTCKPGRRKHKHKRKHKALMLASHRFTRRTLVFMLVLMLMLASYV